MSQKKVLDSKIFGGKYVQGDRLGEGAQATVYKFSHKDPKTGEVTIYACKQTATEYLTKCTPQKSKSRWNSMIRELVILEIIDSPNIVKVHEFIRTRNNFYMIQEFANGGSLQGLLDCKVRFSELIAKKMLKQIITGMTALYDIKVAHRDLKLDNILVSFPNLGETITKQ